MNSVEERLTQIAERKERFISLLIFTVIFGCVVALPIWINNWMNTVTKVEKAVLIEEATFSDGFMYDSTTVRKM